MKRYALNDTVHELLSSFATNPTGSILISGNVGSGLSTAIRYLISSIYGQNVRPGETIVVESGKIEEVRQLIDQISRTRVNIQKPRLVIIDDAHKLTAESQNALLKSLEEPPERTHFVLATSQLDKLLSTVISRTHHIKLRRPSREDLREIFSAVDDPTFDHAYNMSDGWPGALQEILEDSSADNDIQIQVAMAKKFLSSSAYDRQISLRKNDDKEYLGQLLEGLHRVSMGATRVYAKKGDRENTQIWKARVDLLSSVGQMHRDKINPKLLGAKLSLEL